MDGLAQNIPDEVRALAAAFWPGGLTIVLEAQPSLAWDLGDTNGTVAVRVPAHPVALELLAETGPLAVSSANLTGQPAATTAAGAHDQLGARVEVYLDGGEATEGLASTIVDATALSRGTGGIRILRDGVVTAAQLRDVIGDTLEPSTEAVG
jgi:tRNA threonylcarbamoyl adenosine modification protein (Sua5/YciO/YrdC/YwlC family)